MSQLKRFSLSVLFWLPVCFAIWYYMSILFTIPLATLTNSLMTWLFPTIIEHVRQHGNNLNVLTKLAAQVPSGTAAGVSGDIVFSINPLIYGYCIPLYSALVLATPVDEAKQAGYWLVGILVLFAVQIFGIATDILKILMLLSDESRMRLGFTDLGYNLVALGYQFGYLILPPVAPIVLWLGQFQQIVTNMVDE